MVGSRDRTIVLYEYCVNEYNQSLLHIMCVGSEKSRSVKTERCMYLIERDTTYENVRCCQSLDLNANPSVLQISITGLEELCFSYTFCCSNQYAQAYKNRIKIEMIKYYLKSQNVLRRNAKNSILDLARGTKQPQQRRKCVMHTHCY